MKTTTTLFRPGAWVLSLLLLTGSVANGQVPDENVAFKWAFGAMAGTGSDKTFVTIARDTVLRSGDDIKMLVHLVKDCFVYLIHVGSKGDVNLLFPYSIRQFATDYHRGKNYYIPKGRTWTQLDNTKGRETFHLLASSERLLQLEVLWGNYAAAEADKKPMIGKQVISEVRDVRKKFKSFATLAEKPITIGGNIRSLEEAETERRPDVADIALEISAVNFYSKTFTIDHQ